MKLLKMYADWCGPCKALSMTLNGMDLKIPLEEINIETDTDTAIKYGVRSIPVLILAEDDGTEIRKIMGAQPKERIQEFLGEYA